MPSSPADLDDSTTDESDDDLNASRNKGAPLESNTDVERSKHNVDNSISDIDDRPAKSPSSREKSIDLDENTPLKAKPPLENQLSQSPDVPKSKSKLGKIGGKKKVEIAGHSPKTEPVVHPTFDTQLTGNEATPRVPQSAVQTSPTLKGELRGRATTPAKSASPTRETSEERANRNREQLKHKLDNKAQAGTKKKRKF